MDRYVQRQCTSQHGGALLVTLFLLLALTSIATLSALRQNIFVNSMNVNTQNLVLANASAESALAVAMNRIQSDPTFIESEIETKSRAHQLGLGKAKATISRQATERFSKHMELIKITVHGSGLDNFSNSVISQAILRYPLLRASPPAAIFIKGSLQVNLDLALVYVRPKKQILTNKLIWLAGNLIGEERIVNCTRKLHSVEDCNNKDVTALSKTQTNDEVTQLVPFLFNLTKQDWPYLQDEFANVIQGCDRQILPATPSSLWVIGDCWLEDKIELGTPKKPILMVVQNGDLHFRGQNKIYGLLLVLSTSTFDTTHEITVNGRNQISGAIAANTDIKLEGDSLDILFEEALIAQLYKQPYLWKVARIPGSWQDFQ